MCMLSSNICDANSSLQAVSFAGDVEKYLMHQKDAIQTALARLLVSKKVKTAKDLVDLYQIPGVCLKLFICWYC